MNDTVVNQYGNHPVYFGNVNGDVYMNSSGGSVDYRQIFHDISTDLRVWRSVLYEEKHIPRQQTDVLLSWINTDFEKDKERVAILVGAPGSGKSVVMRDLLEQLEGKEDTWVLGLKSDQIGFESMESLASQNGISRRMEDVIRELARSKGSKRVVLLVDQIDALSLTLSSNRKPLRSILRFIQNVQSEDKVRVVVSCRPYDLEYDPYLEQFQFGTRVQMDPLKPEVVEEVLKTNGRHAIPQGTNLFNTLRTPLFLYLFLKLKENNTLDVQLTEHGLYDCLWAQSIEGDLNLDSGRVDYQRLLGLLDQIAGRMYDSQSLTLSKRAIDSCFSYELDYLLHEEFLLQVSENRIQFFHQSLFDYVFARRFVERGDDLLATIKDTHQGLFIRALVKSVLAFMRETPEKYLNTVRSILFEKDTAGRDVYRYHLKMLILSMMGYSVNLSPAEIVFVRDEISADAHLSDVFIKGIRSKEWFSAIKGIIDHTGGWKSMSEKDCLLMVGVCSRIIFSEQREVLDYFNSYYADDIFPEIRHGVVNTLNTFRPDCENVALAESLYDKIIRESGDISLSNLLSNMVDLDPDFVLSRLRKMVSFAIDVYKKKRSGIDIQLNHELEHIYEKLYEQYPDKCYDEFLSIVLEICDKTKLKKQKDTLVWSRAYWMFKPISNPRIGYKFADEVLSLVIAETEKRAKEESKYVVPLVKRLNKSKFDTVRLIPACAFVANPSLFKAQILAVFTDTWLLSCCSGLLKFYYRKALNVSFSLFTKDEQGRILNAIMGTALFLEKEYTIKDHQKWAVGISLIDELKYEYLSEIPDALLKEEFKEVYKKKQECMRRFGVRENKMPYQITSHWGWTSLDITPERARKMTSAQWLKAMRKYTSNAHLKFDTPTLQGNSQLFEQTVSTAPEKYVETIKVILADSEIPNAYAYAGLRGLISAQYEYSVVEDIYLKMISLLNPDINENKPSELLSLIRQSEYFVESKNPLRKEIVDFLTVVVREYNDKREDKEEDENESTPYQTGINEVRGSACEYLMECYRHKEYKEAIFSAYETLPGNATIHTRSAVLFKMALLNYLDTKRSLDLYLKLMSDYRPNLLAMPLHNLNPLVYYINYGFDRLIPLFEKAIEIPLCHEEMAPLLWLAWAKKKEGADDLLSRMLQSSDKAKGALVNYLVRSHDQKIDQSLVIPWIKHCLLSKQIDGDLSQTYDGIFDDLVPMWPAEDREEITSLYILRGWLSKESRDFVKYLGSLAFSNPSECLQWLRLSLEACSALMEGYLSSRIIEILIQAYNGLSDFGSRTPDLEFAMDLLDDILSNQEHAARLDMFLYQLDNA